MHVAYALGCAPARQSGRILRIVLRPFKLSASAQKPCESCGLRTESGASFQSRTILEKTAHIQFQPKGEHALLSVEIACMEITSRAFAVHRDTLEHSLCASIESGSSKVSWKHL